MGKAKDAAGSESAAGQGARALAAGTVIDGRYKVVRAIGQGGYGMVHEVEHVVTGRRLALKSLLDASAFGRLQQEARATSLLKNPHATRITDMGKGPPAFLVMELLEGQSLRALLEEAGQLPLELTVNVALQVCECLSEAHKNGIVHRDLKPENVFLSPSQWPGQHEIKVLDFGVVKIEADGSIPSSSLTRTGSTVGTPYYMSLEQLRNSSAVDSRTDVYALGVVLYECFTGKKPFQADTIGDLVYAICSGPPTHVSRLRPDLPADVCEMVMKALSVNKDERPKTMDELAATLLPHGNPAFGLWLRIDGKQPALKAASKSLVPEKPTASVKPGGQTATFAPRPFPDGAPGGSKPPAAPPRVPLPPPRPLAGAVVPAPLPPTPPPTPLWTEGTSGDNEETKDQGGRRDTPTEMYRKEAHEESSSGDRDTPTRAIRTDLLEEQQRRRPHAPTLKSPFGINLGAGNEPTADVPQGARGVELGFNRGGAPVTDLGSTLALDPQLPQPIFPAPPAAGPSGFEPPPFQASPFARPSSEQMMFFPGAPASAINKPGWQKSLDGALAWVGRFVEGLLGKYRAASPGVRIFVTISLALVGLSCLGLLVMLLVR